MERPTSIQKSRVKIRKVIADGPFSYLFPEPSPMNPEILEDLAKYQRELHEINMKASEEFVKIEQKYNEQRKPLFAKRNKLYNTIPYFWLTVLLNHKRVSAIVAPYEIYCLRYLSKIDIEEHDDATEYQIKFYFDDNPFFENSFICKEFNYNSFAISHHTPILWREGMCLLNEKQHKKNTRKQNYKPTTFFSWYEDHTNPSGDYIADAIKEDIWQNPLKYYLDFDKKDPDISHRPVLEESADSSQQPFDEETVVATGEGSKDTISGEIEDSACEENVHAMSEDSKNGFARESEDAATAESTDATLEENKDAAVKESEDVSGEESKDASGEESEDSADEENKHAPVGETKHAAEEEIEEAVAKKETEEDPDV